MKRRFETDPGKEMQVDWSPFRLKIGGKLLLVHALTVILCYCRKLFLVFFRDERQHTLLEGLARAFEYFEGCAIDLVLDNMSTAVLGRWGPDRKPIWHPSFLDFARHYAINPFPCAVRDPDRKGKIEKPFRLVFDDFLKEKSFRSWDDLEKEASYWLDQDTTNKTGNLRTHGTTGQVPSVAYLSERDFLIRLPRERFPVHEDVLRIVDNDCTLSVHERRYSVPSSLANRTVPVRLFAHHFEVVDPNGRVAFRLRGPRREAQAHHRSHALRRLPRRPKGAHNPERLTSFLRRFPTLATFVDGSLKMKTLASSTCASCPAGRAVRPGGVRSRRHGPRRRRFEACGGAHPRARASGSRTGAARTGGNPAAVLRGGRGLSGWLRAPDDEPATPRGRQAGRHG